QAPSGDRTTNTWDYENRTTLVQLPSGIRNTMAYEPGGLRVKLEESTGTKKFIWDGHQAYLAESDANDDTSVVYTQEPVLYGNLVSQRRSITTSWYHYEALGSTRQLTDATEAVTDHYLYDAWGNVLSSNGSTVNPFMWTGNVGYHFDQDVDSYYIRARTFRPTIGRWLSVDPLGFIDGENLYRAFFIPGNTDPSGAALITIVAGGYLGWCAVCLYHYNHARAEYGGQDMNVAQRKCMFHAGDWIRTIDRWWSGSLPGQIRTRGGNFTETYAAAGCDCQTFYAATDIDCNTCDGFINLVATIWHESEHCKQVHHPKTYCKEKEFIEKKIMPNCRNAPPPCQKADECRAAAKKYRDIADDACKNIGTL
ncbi:MAG: RHS repeat-associated core domain-containing protein, partial [Planctomycetaceae bacterium]|nr:RHS repeat-associated core domain-containing protein [Planctomycetaceae bacterium]